MAGIELDMNDLSTNPEDLHKVFEQIEAGEAPDIKAPEPEQPPEQSTGEAQGSKEPAPDEPSKAEAGLPDDEANAAGVATKDGKHVIPYSVLKSERDRAARAEQIAREASERVAALEAQLKAGNQGANNGEGARTEQQQSGNELSPEDLEALKEDFPTVFKAVQAAMAKASQLESKLQPVEDVVRSHVAERARSDVEVVQEAIDATPKLAHIQATNQEAFELASQFDAMLRSQPAWAGKSMTERFAKVVEMVESATGPINLPDAKPSTPSTEDLAKAARAKAASSAAANRSAVPTSLSEFPAGQHAARDANEAVEQLTHQQLAEKFSRMSPDEMDAYFRSL